MGKRADVITGGNSVEKKSHARLMSLDALRGFDMLFIMGGEQLVYAIAALLGYPAFKHSFAHVPWDGLQFMDTVFPLFLFMAGVSFPFSCAKSRERGSSDREIALKGLKRGLILVLLGLLPDLLKFRWCKFRAWSVLGRIGIAWMVASWLYLLFKTKTRIIIAGAILAGVTVGTMLLLAPDAATVVYPEKLQELAAFGRGPFSAAGNFGCWLDRTITGGHIYGEIYDPEGFAGILPSIVTAMLGMFAGEIVRRGGAAATTRKTLQLLACGIGCTIAGLLLSLICPINKALWSPSFTLVVGGYSFAIFALFYWIIDVRKYRKWSFFFQVIGMNSITIYMAQQIIGFNQARRFFFGGLISHCPQDWRAVVSAAAYIVVCWVFLLFLYRKKIFLKV